MMDRRKYFNISFIYLLTGYLIFGSLCFGQKSDPALFGGLFFSGNHIPPASPYRNTPVYKLQVKTKLQLTNEKPINLEGNYSLSFKVSFWTDFSHGNIFKVENAGYTLKFNFDHHPDSATVHLLLALNSEPPTASFTFNRSEIHDGIWFDILIKVDETNGIITGKVNGIANTYRTKPFHWSKESHISFGADGPTQDCAAMILKDLRLSISGILQHQWLFTEMEGNKAFDALGNLDALVTNHDWLISRHLSPSEKDSFFIASGGPVSVTVDKSVPSLIIQMPGEIKIYDLRLRTFSRFPLIKGNGATGSQNDGVKWNSNKFEFENSVNQLRYSLYRYPGESGVLIRIFTQRLPVITPAEYNQLLENSPVRVRDRERVYRFWAFAGGGFLLLVISGYTLLRYSQKQRLINQKAENESLKSVLIKEFPKTGYISIFGGLKLIDKNGFNHADKIPRLLKEILAVIVYHSKNSGDPSQNGVDFKLLEEVFWYDIKSENLKNNRNVAFTNIRKAIKDFEGLVLTSMNNRVMLECTVGISNRIDEFFDLLEYLESKDITGNEKSLASFAGIVNEGIAFNDLHSEWAENTRNILRSKVISILERYQLLLFERGDFSSCIKIANIALLHDSLHEVTLKFLLRSLSAINKAQEAERFYRNFCEQYFDVFKEEFPFELEELLEE